MKRFLSLVVFVTALFILERCFTFAETFTEGVRVSPDTVTLKPGEYVWEPERAPEGPLLIVAALPSRWRMCTAMVSASHDQASVLDGRATALPPACSRFWKKRSIIPRVSTKAQRCLTWSGSPGAASRCTPATCRVTLTRMDASGCRLSFRNSSSE